jgi:8-oxo-dGTP pyrophosphatase MutT (NUDIX family)
MMLAVELRRTGYRVAYVLLAIYWWIGRPELHGVKCVLTDGDRILLVRHTYGPRAWDLPGGRIKRGEPPLSTARREMQEELGLTIDDWTSLGEVVTDVYRRRDTLHCFQAEVPGPRITPDPVEIATTRWFARRGLPHNLSRFVPQVLDRLASSPPPAGEASRPRTSRNPR